jgi:hypothetical protein
VDRVKYNGKTDTSTISGRLCELGYDRYRDYLASEHWRQLRRRYRESDLPQTCKCGAPGRDLHHLTYERLGSEHLEDLALICGKCHRAEHRKKKPKRHRSTKKRGVSVRFVEPAPQPRDWHYEFDASEPGLTL